LILLPYDAGVIKKGLDNRRDGSLYNQGLSPSIVVYQQEMQMLLAHGRASPSTANFLSLALTEA
jgi:hypothetical protein